MNDNAERRNGIVLSLFCLLLIGAMPVIANGRPEGTSALTYTLFLSLWQLAFSLPLAFRDWHKTRKFSVSSQRASGDQTKEQIASKRQWAILIGTGMLFGVSTFLYVFSAEKAGSVNSAIAIQAYPLFAILLEVVFLKQRKSSLELGFTFLLIAALVFLATDGTFQLQGLSFWFLFALTVPMIWAVAHISLRGVMQRSNLTPGMITCVRVAVSSLLLLGLHVGLEGVEPLLRLARDGAFLASSALMGFVYYSELVLWFYAVRRIDVSLASSIVVPAPAVTMILAMLFLAEPTSIQQIAAFGLILISLYGLLYANGRAARTKATA